MDKRNILTSKNESANIVISMEGTSNTPQNESPSPEKPFDTAQGKPADRDTIIKLEGRVIEALPNAFFKVLLDDLPHRQAGNREILGFLSGKMKLNRIKILPGDKVTLEMTPYDTQKGRIVYRLK